MLLKLLGEEGERSLLSGAVSVSAPMDLAVCVKRMSRGFSRVYQRRLMKDLIRLLIKKYFTHDMDKMIGINQNEVKKLKTFWEFDDIYTGPIHGFSGADEYYQKSSSKQFLKNIKIATLIINAKDDPFMTPEVLPKKEEMSETITLEVSQHGGHVGFVGGTILSPEYYLEQRIIDFLIPNTL
jgi:uncharacterized protein